jgi:hypothetical protein
MTTPKQSVTDSGNAPSSIKDWQKSPMSKKRDHIPPTEYKAILRRLRKAQKTNSDLAASLRETGKSIASEYAEGSAFAFWQAARILTGEAK